MGSLFLSDGPLGLGVEIGAFKRSSKEELSCPQRMSSGEEVGDWGGGEGEGLAEIQQDRPLFARGRVEPVVVVPEERGTDGEGKRGEVWVGGVLV